MNLNYMKTKSIHFRVHPVEKQGLELLAIRERRSPSEMMREIMQKGFEWYGVDLEKMEKRANEARN